MKFIVSISPIKYKSGLTADYLLYIELGKIPISSWS